jgi:hypothetical protein
MRTDRQLNTIRKIKHEQNKISSEADSIRKHKMQILALKNTMTKFKNSWKAPAANLIKQNKESVSLNAKYLKLLSQRSKNKRITKSLQDLRGTNNQINMCIMQVTKRVEKRKKIYLKKY